ncbi:hypothetical protein EYF80_006718 [Liparis tanakae]|uniref:Uncharacterized protein n=1 Tax=Liparis tanakae TaxID=230148 RepID=A0A4Z2IZ95_9TELE|nr:hypothetical protein EYF80_006718 [Liparis tanakae]
MEKMNNNHSNQRQRKYKGDVSVSYTASDCSSGRPTWNMEIVSGPQNYQPGRVGPYRPNQAQRAVLRCRKVDAEDAAKRALEGERYKPWVWSDSDTPWSCMMEEKALQRGKVELLEKEAKQNEDLQKQSCLKNVEKIQENRISTPCSENRVHQSAEVNSPRTQNNQTSWRKPCPVQGERPAQAAQGARGGEQAARQATRPRVEPTKPQSIPHQCKERTIPTEAPEPIKAVEEEVDEGTSQLLAKENAILRGQVELLETDAKLNEALQKESRLKKVEAISDLKLQLALKKVTEAETGHRLKQLEEALQLQRESQWELEINLTPTLLLLKKSQEDAEKNLAQQRETGRQLQAALTESLTQSNSQQLQWQEEKGHLLQALSQITSSLEEMRVVPKPKKLSLGKRIVQFFRRSGG